MLCDVCMCGKARFHSWFLIPTDLATSHEIPATSRSPLPSVFDKPLKGGDCVASFAIHATRHPRIGHFLHFPCQNQESVWDWWMKWKLNENDTSQRRSVWVEELLCQESVWYQKRWHLDSYFQDNTVRSRKQVEHGNYLHGLGWRLTTNKVAANGRIVNIS